jgi:hypothetical protein
LWASGDRQFHHNNVLAHSTALTQAFFWQNIASLRSVRLPTVQICLPATSGFS